MSWRKSIAIVVTAGPIIGLLWLGRSDATSNPPYSRAAVADELAQFVKPPIEKLFGELVGNTVVNGDCLDEKWLCIQIIGAPLTAIDDPNGRQQAERVQAAGALAVAPNTILISERYLAQLFQQASTDLAQYHRFLKHLDFAQMENVAAAAKATGLSEADIFSMRAGTLAVSSKLADYERNPWNNYAAGREADRSALLQLLIEEAVADGVVPTEEDISDAISTLQKTGYPENVALLLSWTLYHEFRHLSQAQDPLSRVTGIFTGRRSFEDDADEFATEQVEFLIEKLASQAGRNTDRSAALQSAQRASRSFWTMGALTKAVQKVIGIPLSRMTYLVDAQCAGNGKEDKPVDLLSARSRFFKSAENAQVFRSRSLLLSEMEFEHLHRQMRDADATAAHRVDYYRGISPIEAPTFDDRGSKLWSDENVEWSVQKGLYNGSRAFLPDRGLTTVTTPVGIEKVVDALKRTAPELIDEDVANFCGRSCRLFVAKTERVNARVEIFHNRAGKVEALNLVAVDLEPGEEEPRAARLIFDLAAELLTSGPVVPGDDPKKTAAFIRDNVLPDGFVTMGEAQASCGLDVLTYKSGPLLVRVQRSDDIYYQLQLLPTGEPAADGF